MLLLLFVTVFFSCFVVLVSFLRRELLPWRLRRVRRIPPKTQQWPHQRRIYGGPLVCPSYLWKLIWCLSAVCVCRISYTCVNTLTFIRGGGPHNYPWTGFSKVSKSKPGDPILLLHPGRFWERAQQLYNPRRRISSEFWEPSFFAPHTRATQLSLDSDFFLLVMRL